MNKIRRVFLFLSTPKHLVVEVAILSFVSVILSIGIFYVQNQKNDSIFTAMFENDMANRFVAKNDTFRLNEILSRIRFTSTDGKTLTVPLEPSFVEQTINAYYGMVGVAPDPKSGCLAAARDQTALPGFDTAILDKANDVVVTNFNKYAILSKWENILFWLLMFAQMINVALATLLFYVERKVDSVRNN